MTRTSCDKIKTVVFSIFEIFNKVEIIIPKMRGKIGKFMKKMIIVEIENTSLTLFCRMRYERNCKLAEHERDEEL